MYVRRCVRVRVRGFQGILRSGDCYNAFIASYRRDGFVAAACTRLSPRRQGVPSLCPSPPPMLLHFSSVTHSHPIFIFLLTASRTHHCCDGEVAPYGVLLRSVRSILDKRAAVDAPLFSTLFSSVLYPFLLCSLPSPPAFSALSSPPMKVSEKVRRCQDG
jgi:hypothetical protein